MVRTWENRSLPDSLFQDAGRRGWRAGMSLRRGSGRTLSLWGSLRRDDRTGQSYLKLPVPEPETVQKVLDLFGALTGRR